MDITLYRYQLPFTQPLKFHGHTIQQREGLLLHWGSSWSEIALFPAFPVKHWKKHNRKRLPS